MYLRHYTITPSSDGGRQATQGTQGIGNRL